MMCAKEVAPLERCAMLLAEGLAARKDSIKEIEDLRGRLAAAVVRYEDEDSPADDPDLVVNDLTRSLDRFQSLSVQINRTNNATLVRFDGSEVSLMEAIALRERLVLEARARQGAVEAMEAATGGGKSGRRSWLGPRRTKDDVRELPRVEFRTARRAADDVSESLRRLDLAMQQRNWTTELQE